MFTHYPEAFDREMTCTEAEWLRWLPAAVGAHPHSPQAQAWEVQLGDGALTVRWQVGEPRAIAAVRLPRLVVSFCFTGVPDAQRHAFMTRFDLYMQRGGG